MNRKKELRKQIACRGLKLQQNLPILQQQSAKILAILEAHPAFRAANIVLLYHSLPDEVDTHAFIQKWSDKKRILLPVVVDNDLELRIYTSSDELLIGSYGIKEPKGKAFTAYEKIDFIVVPGVAFDTKGNRLGRGKGYYDRLLLHIPTAYKVGICFPHQLVTEVPTEPYDICMDEVITINDCFFSC